MDAAKVIKAAETTIQAIKDRREKEDEETISWELEKTYHTWYLKPYRPTREQAIDRLNKKDTWGWRSVYAWGDLEKAKKLLHLAKHGDPVMLNEEDCRVLF